MKTPATIFLSGIIQRRELKKTRSMAGLTRLAPPNRRNRLSGTETTAAMTVPPSHT